jgi:hypothetical protein
MGSRAWKVTLNGKFKDIVHYDESYRTADEVKRSLVNHDGYDAGIVVKRHGWGTRRPYIGLNNEAKVFEVFRSEHTPTEESHPQYKAVIGPFRTAKAARLMQEGGPNNPHFLTVADAERAAKG